MGVARSTVREAIKRLESQNILTVRHGAGSFVTDQPGLVLKQQIADSKHS